MKGYIALGTGAVLITMAVLGVIVLNEQARMQTFTAAFEARQVENGAILFENNCRSCHGPQGKGIQGVAPAINAPDLFNGTRLENIGFAGTTEDYVRGVIQAGRPVPSEGTNYPQRMPTWSEELGGPLKQYQINELVAFVMNWEETALQAPQPTAMPEGDRVGTDITIDLPAGDADNGQALAEGGLGCVGCHILSETGPAWEGSEGTPGIGTRAAARIEQANYTGQAQSAQQYLIESIVQTDAHVVEGFQSGLMPGDYGSRLSPQDMADLIAYLETFK